MEGAEYAEPLRRGIEAARAIRDSDRLRAASAGTADPVAWRNEAIRRLFASLAKDYRNGPVKTWDEILQQFNARSMQNSTADPLCMAVFFDSLDPGGTDRIHAVYDWVVYQRMLELAATDGESPLVWCVGICGDCGLLANVAPAGNACGQQ